MDDNEPVVELDFRDNKSDDQEGIELLERIYKNKDKIHILSEEEVEQVFMDSFNGAMLNTRNDLLGHIMSFHIHDDSNTDIKPVIENLLNKKER